LIDKLTEQLFVFKGDAEVVIYNGNYADFKLEQEALEKKVEKKVEKVQPVQEKKKKLSFKEQHEFESLEKEIETLENQVSELTEKLSSTTNHMELQEIAEEIEKSKTSLDSKTERWMELAEFI